MEVQPLYKSDAFFRNKIRLAWACACICILGKRRASRWLDKKRKKDKSRGGEASNRKWKREVAQKAKKKEIGMKKWICRLSSVGEEEEKKKMRESESEMAGDRMRCYMFRTPTVHLRQQHQQLLNRAVRGSFLSPLPFFFFFWFGSNGAAPWHPQGCLAHASPSSFHRFFCCCYNFFFLPFCFCARTPLEMDLICFFFFLGSKSHWNTWKCTRVSI